jgi:hypothetical protein
MDWGDLAAILLLGVACGGWALLQRWIERRDPGNPGLARECDGTCRGCDTGRCHD